MPYLTNLATVVRRSGLKVVEVAGWKSRGHGPMGTVQTITCHHTATPRSFKRSQSYPTMGVVRDGRPGLPGPLAQLGLGRDGTVYVIAAGLSYHAGRSHKSSQTNSHAIGIEAEGAMEAWPSVQYQAYLRLVKALLTAWPKAAVVGHKESAAPSGRKNDPSFSMSKFRSDLKKTSTGGKPPTEAKGILGMTKRIAGSRRKRYDVKGDNTLRHLPVSESGKDYTIVSGPAVFDAGVKVDVRGLKKGELAYLVLTELLYKSGNSRNGRELDAVAITENGVHSVHGAFQLYKDYQGRNPRLRVAIKTKAKGVYVENLYVSGIRD